MNYLLLSLKEMILKRIPEKRSEFLEWYVLFREKDKKIDLTIQFKSTNNLL